LKLSKAQQIALERLSETEWKSAHDISVSLRTLYALEERGLVRDRPDFGLGAVITPEIDVLWKKNPKDLEVWYNRRELRA
jgi:hypothetical protein